MGISEVRILDCPPRSGGATVSAQSACVPQGKTRAAEGRFVASSNLAPNTKFDVRKARSPTRQRQHAQTVSCVGSNPTEPTKAPVVQLVETTALKAAPCRFESGEAHHTPRLPMVRRADSKPAIGCSNHPRGAMCRNSEHTARSCALRAPSKVASGRVATSLCAVRFRDGAPSFRMWRSGRAAKVTSPENWRESARATEG